MSTSAEIILEAKVPAALSGKRLDQIAAQLFPDYSRARLQQWIRQGNLRVNKSQARTRDKLREDDVLDLNATLEAIEHWQPEAQDLAIVFEDEHLLVINKATDTVVHPAAGHRQGTLLNGLLHYCPSLEQLPRAGIVHRLDKDTTGLMVVAKSLLAHTSLVKQLQSREVSREYEAVVKGVLTGGGRIEQPLGRHPVNRKKRAVVMNGQEAISHYRVIKRFRAHTHVQVKLETGRTHQIRVHMSHINYALVGDPLYGGRFQIPQGSSPQLIETLQNFERQALHARRLALKHPATAALMEWESELPADMQQLLQLLQADL